MKKYKRTIYILITVLIMALIFIHSSFPADLSGRESDFFVQFIRMFWDADPRTISYAVRKTAHFLEYFILGYSLFFTAGLKYSGYRQLLLAWGTGSAYAVTDEIHQMFSPGRSCEITDMLIDSAGVMSGVLIAKLVSRKKQTTHQP